MKVVLASILAVVVTLAVAYWTMNSVQESSDLETVQADAPGKLIKLPDGIVHYLLSGADSARTVVLITGGGVTGMEVWGKTIPFLVDKGYRVLAYDLYGRGYSDRPYAANTPELLGRQLTKLMDTLAIRQRVDVIAMSFGAILALDFIKDHPARINKVILLDPTITGEYRIPKILRIPIVSPLVMTLYWYPRSIENQRKEFFNKALFTEYSKRLGFFMRFKGYKKMTHDTWMYILNQDRLALMSSVPPESLLVIFGNSDPYFPAGNIPIFEKVYPTLKSRAIPDAGHMPQYEKPEEVNQMIDDFLKEAIKKS